MQILRPTFMMTQSLPWLPIVGHSSFPKSSERSTSWMTYPKRRPSWSECLVIETMWLPQNADRMKRQSLSLQEIARYILPTSLISCLTFPDSSNIMTTFLSLRRRTISPVLAAAIWITWHGTRAIAVHKLERCGTPQWVSMLCSNGDLEQPLYISAEWAMKEERFPAVHVGAVKLHCSSAFLLISPANVAGLDFCCWHLLSFTGSVEDADRFKSLVLVVPMENSGPG